DPGEGVVLEDVVDVTPPGHLGQVQVDREMPGGAWCVVARCDAGGEDLGEGFDQRAGLFSPASAHLESQQVHAAVDEPAVVGQFALDFLGQVTATSDLVEW